ncbi:MAG: CRISPR-associated protein Cas4 [Candidatus Altiarchaeota archaeon]
MTENGLRYVNASDMNVYAYCPRLLYLQRVMGLSNIVGHSTFKGLMGHAVRKELSLRQAKIMRLIREKGSADGILDSELDRISRDLPHIFREWWIPDHASLLGEVKNEVSSEFRILADKMDLMVSEMGYEKALEYMTPWKIEYSIKSESLMLKGRVDKIMRRDSLFPVELKTGVPPENVHNGHRLQICSYSMLVEDEFGVMIPYGMVEYVRVHESRPVLNTEKLRREVLYSRDLILELLDGDLPEVCPHGSGKKCESCSLMQECYRI